MEITRIDNEEEFKYLRTRPSLAWPTVLLEMCSLIAIIWSWHGVLTEQTSIWFACLVNCIAYYYLFTPAHDGLHRAISKYDNINDFFAYLAIVPISIVSPAFEYFKMFHMQHHIKCGDPDLDPDLKISSRWTNAFSLWMVWGIQYYNYYKTYRDELPTVNVKYAMPRVLVTLAVLGYLWIALPVEMILLWLIPVMFTVWMTAFVFSFLPHHVHERVEGEDEMSKYQTTCNREGYEWLLSPLTQNQNYHLVHHIYPTVPFYRYRTLWLAGKTKHENEKPAVVPAFSNSLSLR